MEIKTVISPKGHYVSNAIPDDYEKQMDEKWLEQIVYGPPMFTKTKTSDELKKLGFVGVYFKQDAPR